MLVIRLRRTGKKKKPSFRVIVAEKTMPIYGRFVDIIGNVNLQVDPKVINIDKEKSLEWMKKGAQPSDTVARLMVKAGILNEKDVKMKPEKKRPKKKEAKKEETGKEAETPTEKPAKEESMPKTDQPKAEKAEEKTEEAPLADDERQLPGRAIGQGGQAKEESGTENVEKKEEPKEKVKEKTTETKEKPKEEQEPVQESAKETEGATEETEEKK